MKSEKILPSGYYSGKKQCPKCKSKGNVNYFKNLPNWIIFRTYEEGDIFRYQCASCSFRWEEYINSVKSIAEETDEVGYKEGAEPEKVLKDYSYLDEEINSLKLLMQNIQDESNLKDKRIAFLEVNLNTLKMEFEHLNTEINEIKKSLGKMRSEGHW